MQDISQSSIFKLLVARRSLRFLSRRLGVSWTTLYRWKNGEATMSWDGFVRLSLHCNRDIPQMVLEVFGVCHPLDLLRSSKRSTRKEISQSLGISRFTLSKILKGHRRLSFPEGLNILRFQPDAFELFLLKLVHSTSRHSTSSLSSDSISIQEIR